MRLHVILRYIGIVMLLLSLFMFGSAGMSYFNGVDSAFYPLLLSSLLTALLGVLPLIFVEKQERISNKEGFCIVVGSWLLACVVGMFPYLIWGGEFTPVNAWFESVSGFTTTGASILKDVEALPRGLLFWRTCSTWVGGMGVVMFALVILPSMGANKMMKSGELSSLAKDNYHYRARIIVRVLLVVYVGLTALFTLLLKAADMGWFDALCHAMSACATSGLSTKNASIGAFDSVSVDLIMMAAMIISGIHFGLIYATAMGRTNNVMRSEVARFYLAMLVVGGLLIAANLWFSGIYESFWGALRHGSFQFVSVVTTSGFATADSMTWTPFAMVMMMFGAIVCACSGSTSGGIKVNRLLLAIKMLRLRIKQRQHPHAVIHVKLDGVIQDNETLQMVTLFIVAYLLLILVGTLLQTLFGLDLMTAFSSSISSIGNVGPGFGEMGSLGVYAHMPTPVKVVQTLLMLLGRLEIFGLLQFFLIKWWK